MKDPQRILNGIQSLLLQFDASYPDEAPLAAYKVLLKHLKLTLVKGDLLAARLYLRMVQDAQNLLNDPNFRAEVAQQDFQKQQEKKLAEISSDNLAVCFRCKQYIDLSQETYIETHAGYMHYECGKKHS